MKAFLKKEWMEGCRSGRFLFLLLVFALFGIMNPALAKLTPWLVETLSESLADAGLATAAVTVDAMVSWAQFYKNIPLAMLIFLLINHGSFTSEYQKGTLIPVVTKGLSRPKILFAKSLVLFAGWTLMYGACLGITYGYNAYFWDNAAASHLFYAAALTWLFGIWLAALLVFFSSAASNGTQVLCGAGGTVLGAYLLSFFPKLAPCLPTKLLDGMSLMRGASVPGDYCTSIAVTVCTAILCMAMAGFFFGRKQL